jgi:hypothetical protein
VTREPSVTTIWHIAAVLFAAFALSPSTSWGGGWSLMVAPATKDDKGEYRSDLSQPLKVWDQHRSFDSAAACETDRSRELAQRATLSAIASQSPGQPGEKFDFIALSTATEQWLLSGDLTKIPPRMAQLIARAVLAFMYGYLCIATDDPRLK